MFDGILPLKHLKLRVLGGLMMSRIYTPVILLQCIEIGCFTNIKNWGPQLLFLIEFCFKKTSKTTFNLEFQKMCDYNKLSLLCTTILCQILESVQINEPRSKSLSHLF